MNVRKLIQRRIRHSSSGVDIAGDINAVIAGNVGESGRTTSHTSTRQTVVHRKGRTHVSEEKETDAGTGAEPSS